MCSQTYISIIRELKMFSFLKNLNSNQRHDLTVLFVAICIMFVSTLLLSISNNSESKEEAFNNSEVLVCYETLIVTDSNWHLSGDNLINNNSAGYVKLRDCKVKHENK